MLDLVGEGNASSILIKEKSSACFVLYEIADEWVLQSFFWLKVPA